MTDDRFTVLVTDKISDSGLEPLRTDDRFEIVKVDDSTDPEFARTLERAHGLIVRSATKVTEEVLADAPLLRVIGRAGVGVDNIDLTAATRNGVAVMNAPAGNTVSAAELTLALMLAMIRRVAEADASMRAGEWARSRFKGAELRGRTLGLIGAGRIGGEVAKRCRAFGMRVIAFDPYLSASRAEAINIERAEELETVLERADVLSLHVPLTDATRGMIDAAALARMKTGAFVVNVARGGVVDEAALAAALEAGSLAGAALDVFANEPLEDDSPLRTAPNLLLTPHLGASTSEAQELVATEIARAVRAALADGDLSPALNAPAISGEAMRALAPLFELGEALGNLGCELARGGVREVEVRYAGASDKALEPLTAYVLVGLLTNVLGADQVNFVSAGHLAAQRNMGVARTRLSRNSDYTEYVEVVVGAEGGDLRLAGALLGDAHPRVVRIADYHVDVVPTGTLIVLRNDDVPGVIGRVGTLLGDHGINIAGYHQARLSKGGDALAAIAADGIVSESVREALLDLPEVSSAVIVRLG
ncbi:MAG: phosphoglycerate dehydrogenase [Gemmatimonadota bacterium]|nr:phosphoglycerate dehydrogenase [Gemmatimonadota bacterium]MDH3424098.1 phosphoglycerate dehydrogenase [Gemmatimonadota bacterium]